MEFRNVWNAPNVTRFVFGLFALLRIFSLLLSVVVLITGNFALLEIKSSDELFPLMVVDVLILALCAYIISRNWEIISKTWPVGRFVVLLAGFVALAASSFEVGTSVGAFYGSLVGKGIWTLIALTWATREKFDWWNKTKQKVIK